MSRRGRRRWVRDRDLGSGVVDSGCGRDQRDARARRPIVTAGAAFASEDSDPRPSPGITDGVWVVWRQIQPGLYENDTGAGCFWARMPVQRGAFDAIQSDNAVGHAIVGVLPTDGAFESVGCGQWHAYSVRSKLLTAFSDGTWGVNTEIEPGWYRSSGGQTCYWQRRSNYENDRNGVIAEHQFNTGSGLVHISRSDVAFTSFSCGHWTKITAPGRAAPM